MHPFLPLFTRILFALGLFSATLAVTAEPWIEPGNERTRHHLQLLVDAGHLDASLTTWPLMWSSIAYQLDKVQQKGLSEAELWSYSYLKHEARRAQQSVTGGQELIARSSHLGLMEFGTDSRERFASHSYGSYTGDRFAVKLAATVAGDTLDGNRYRADGSYLAGMFGNWAIGVGAIDRWWGPGWQSSLILSTAARPAPGVFVSRVNNDPFDFPVLEWLGPWDLRIFMNQLESSRGTPEAKLFGMRVTVQPFDQLELGFSRTAQWGGEGRPQDVGSFWDMFIGNDNRGDGDLAEDGSDEPGNQLGGVDWRLGDSIGGVSAAFYGQIIGEDEAGGLPSHVLGMAGLETAFLLGETHNRLIFEASNTTMEFNKGGGSPNVAYEHPRYPSGYRTRGRPIGASTDNDSELYVLKGIHSLPHGHLLSWTLGSGKINTDGTNADGLGGNVFGTGTDNLQYAQLEYSFPMTEKSLLSVGGQYYNDSLYIADQLVETGVHVAFKLRL